jgi:hypothetical protein
MFPTPNNPSEGPARRWRDGLHHTIGTVVAFATLAGAEAPAEGTADPLARPADPPGASTRRPDPHLHRRTLRAPARNRRPGAVRAAPQPCLTPLPARHAGRGRTSLAPSR